MSSKSGLVWLWALLSVVIGVASSFAQKPEEELSERLIGRPLYLREAWISDRIVFDEQGRPIGEVHRGPLTLGGVDIQKVRINGSVLELRGERVALIAPSSGKPLMRSTSLNSTTQIWPSFRKGDGRFYKAAESVQFTVHADSHGSFDAALARIFADGIAEYGRTVPSYWRCYAATFFVDGEVVARANLEVEHCAGTQSRGVHTWAEQAEGGFTPVTVLQQTDSAYTNSAAAMGLTGTSTIYLTVEADGRPSEFQVIEPLGAGLDEETLESVSHFKFQPATLNGRPVRAAFVYELTYGTR
jgi:TonB family protein